MFRGISRTLFRKVREIGQLQDLFYALIDLVDEQLYINLQERDAELRRLRMAAETTPLGCPSSSTSRSSSFAVVS